MSFLIVDWKKIRFSFMVSRTLYLGIRGPPRKTDSCYHSRNEIKIPTVVSSGRRILNRGTRLLDSTSGTWSDGTYESVRFYPSVTCTL